jgi:hypothetical protein
MKKSGSTFFLFRSDFIILTIAIIFGYLMVSGFGFFDFKYTPAKEGEFVAEPPIPSQGDSTLQLKTLKFKECTETSAIDFLLDRSGSMGDNNKLTNLKNAVTTFTSKLSDNSVIGIQDFSADENPRGAVNSLVDISYYKDVKLQLPGLIQSMEANGYTHAKTAFLFARDKIFNAMVSYPKYKFSLIFISDGVPRTKDGDEFDQSQMPNSVATEIKAKDVKIFTITYAAGIEDTTKLKDLMSSLASTPADAYNSPDPTQIEGILNQIATKMCDAPAQ